MGTVPFQSPGMNENPFRSGTFDFGNLPFNFSPFGGHDNGLNMAGAWASGGFNTVGTTPTSGFNSFFGQGTQTPHGSSSMMFGVPQNTFPAFGATTIPGGTVPFAGMGETSPRANNQFGFNSNTGLPTFGAPGIGVQAGSQGPFPQIDTKQLQKLFGSSVGGALSQFLNTGAGFNPQVVQALVNQAMPLEAKGASRLMSQFGSTGNAYSSTAATGLGDFEAQFDANLTAQMAQIYEQSVQNYIAVLESTMSAAKEGKAQAITPLGVLGSLIKPAASGISAGIKGGPLAGLEAALGAL